MPGGYSRTTGTVALPQIAQSAFLSWNRDRICPGQTLLRVQRPFGVPPAVRDKGSRRL
jgi:hypothetical protein